MLTTVSGIIEEFALESLDANCPHFGVLSSLYYVVFRWILPRRKKHSRWKCSDKYISHEYGEIF